MLAPAQRLRRRDDGRIERIGEGEIERLLEDEAAASEPARGAAGRGELDVAPGT